MASIFVLSTTFLDPTERRTSLKDATVEVTIGRGRHGPNSTLQWTRTRQTEGAYQSGEIEGRVVGVFDGVEYPPCAVLHSDKTTALKFKDQIVSCLRNESDIRLDVKLVRPATGALTQIFHAQHQCTQGVLKADVRVRPWQHYD